MNIDELLDQIEASVEPKALIHSTTTLQRSGCKLSLRGMSHKKFVLVDIDEALDDRFTGKKCDFLLFTSQADRVLVVPIELKNTKIEPSHVCAQLQAGANYASRIIPPGVRCSCVPVVVYGKSFHPEQRRSLSKKRVNFQKGKRIIRTAKCNQDRNLANALS